MNHHFFLQYVPDQGSQYKYNNALKGMKNLIGKSLYANDYRTLN